MDSPQKDSGTGEGKLRGGYPDLLFLACLDFLVFFKEPLLID